MQIAEKTRLLERVIDDVEYRVGRGEFRAEIEKWRRVKTPRRLGGLKPRSFFAQRVHGASDKAVTGAHRRLLVTLYMADPVLGRMLVRRAGYRYAERVLGRVDDFMEAGLELARRGIGLFDFLGCRRGRCIFRVYDCLSCSGLGPGMEIGGTMCEWEAGIIEYLVESVLKATPTVRETNCWLSGDPYCQFMVVVRAG
ncbi:MAG: hypothetical protein GXO09_03880 [Crenarchaeota archaeon]|nr:hypothetical protein [Thermoproteota archaeon]